MRALSGGMKRRVLVAQALVHRPAGDRAGRARPPASTWSCARRCGQFVRRLNREGHAIVLTTHYLEEAEQLCAASRCSRRARRRAASAPRRCGRFSGGKLRVRCSGEPLPESLRAAALEPPRRDEATGGWSATLRVDGSAEVESALAQLRQAGCRVDELDLQHVDLEDVFVRVMQEAA
jgi:ABC-2 type transport system ATP-binding protein